VSGFCEHHNEPSSFINKASYRLTSSVTISFSKKILHHEGTKYPVLNHPQSMLLPQCAETKFYTHTEQVKLRFILQVHIPGTYE
jgi:hypothetical protein